MDIYNIIPVPENPFFNVVLVVFGCVVILGIWWLITYFAVKNLNPIGNKENGL